MGFIENGLGSCPRAPLKHLSHQPCILDLVTLPDVPPLRHSLRLMNLSPKEHMSVLPYGGRGSIPSHLGGNEFLLACFPVTHSLRSAPLGAWGFSRKGVGVADTGNKERERRRIMKHSALGTVRQCGIHLEGRKEGRGPQKLSEYGLGRRKSKQEMQ